VVHLPAEGDHLENSFHQVAGFFACPTINRAASSSFRSLGTVVAAVNWRNLLL
jgi:hypothetical protein